MKTSIAALFVLLGAAAASENVVENSLRGSDSVTRKLPKNGGGSKGNGGGGGAKTQPWSCEAVNVPGFGDTTTDITKGDDAFTCEEDGGKKGEDNCEPCCLCSDPAGYTGVCSKEGACGVPLLGNETCTLACNYTP